MSITPTLSVVMNVYNGGAYLPAALESVLGQTFSDFEFIIVDDGSTDDTPATLQRYAEQDERIRIITQPNQGTPTAINNGIAASRADIIARMDADDRMLPQRLEKQLAYLRSHPKATVVSCLAHYINERDEIIGKNYTELLTVADCQRYIDEDKIIFCLHPGAMYWKQPIVEVGGYRPEMIYTQDTDLWNRLGDHGYYTIVMPEILMQYRIHPNSAMNNVGLRTDISSWAFDSARRRRRGEPELSFAEFRAKLASAPWYARFRRRWGVYRVAYYRAAGVMYGSRRYGKFLAYLLISFLMDPRYVFFKLRNQIFSQGSLTSA